MALVAERVYRPQTAIPVCTGEGCNWPVFVRGALVSYVSSLMLSLRVYNMPTVSTISGPCLLAADSVCKPHKLINAPPTSKGGV